jgi:hypothetical protein
LQFPSVAVTSSDRVPAGRHGQRQVADVRHLEQRGDAAAELHGGDGQGQHAVVLDRQRQLRGGTVLVADDVHPLQAVRRQRDLRCRPGEGRADGADADGRGRGLEQRDDEQRHPCRQQRRHEQHRAAGRRRARRPHHFGGRLQHRRHARLARRRQTP